MSSTPRPGSNPATTSSAALSITVSGSDGRRDVVLVGECDSSNIDQIRIVLDACAALGGRVVVLDVAGLRFLSASGLRVLLDADRQLHAAGVRLELAHPDRAVRRVLAITDLDQVLTSSTTPLQLDPPAAEPSRSRPAQPANR